MAFMNKNLLYMNVSNDAQQLMLSTLHVSKRIVSHYVKCVVVERGREEERERVMSSDGIQVAICHEIPSAVAPTTFARPHNLTQPHIHTHSIEISSVQTLSPFSSYNVRHSHLIHMSYTNTNPKIERHIRNENMANCNNSTTATAYFTHK